MNFYNKDTYAADRDSFDHPKKGLSFSNVIKYENDESEYDDEEFYDDEDEDNNRK